MENIDAKDVIFQSNKLIDAKYNLTLQEMRIILHIISLMSPEDSELKYYRIMMKSIIDDPGGKEYKRIDKITDKIMERKTFIKQDNGSFEKHNWIPSCKYVSSKNKNNELGEAYIDIWFNPKLKQYLFDLKNCFTKLELEILLSFRSFYSVRLYKILKSFQGLNQRELTIDWIRERFELQNKYKEFPNFMARVIKPAVAEINEKSDIHVKYEKIKTGRTITSLLFKIRTVKTLPDRRKFPRPSKFQDSGYKQPKRVDTQADIQEIRVVREEQETLKKKFEQIPDEERKYYLTRAENQLKKQYQYVPEIMKQELALEKYMEDQKKS